jgi:hypothetical protein
LAQLQLISSPIQLIKQLKHPGTYKQQQQRHKYTRSSSSSSSTVRCMHCHELQPAQCPDNACQLAQLQLVGSPVQLVKQLKQPGTYKQQQQQQQQGSLMYTLPGAKLAAV